MLGRPPLLHKLYCLTMTTRHDSDRTALQRLFDSFGEAAFDDPEMARDILSDAGLDADRLAEEGAALARSLYRAARLSAAADGRARAEQTVAKLRSIVAARVQALGDVRSTLARLLAGDDVVQLQAHFRKLEEISEEDAIDMLTEAELLQALEKLDREEDDGREGG